MDSPFSHLDLGIKSTNHRQDRTISLAPHATDKRKLKTLGYYWFRFIVFMYGYITIEGIKVS